MMADVANHQRGTTYVVESCQSRRCQLCGTSRHQLPEFPARAGYRSRSGHTAVRELVYQCLTMSNGSQDRICSNAFVSR